MECRTSELGCGSGVQFFARTPALVARSFLDIERRHVNGYCFASPDDRASSENETRKLSVRDRLGHAFTAGKIIRERPCSSGRTLALQRWNLTPIGSRPCHPRGYGFAVRTSWLRAQLRHCSVSPFSAISPSIARVLSSVRPDFTLSRVKACTVGTWSL